jgi:hypothetical protein
MRRKSFVLTGLGLALILCAGTVSAEEIVFFANGTSMPIRTHEIRGEMLHVDLGGDSFMAFPLYMVEKIEKAGQNVILKPSYSAGNQIMPGAGGDGGGRPDLSAAPIRRTSTIRGESTQQQAPIDRKTKGMIGAPVPDSNHTTGRANMKDNFDPRMQRGRSRSNYINTKQIGSKRVVGVDDSVRRSPVPASITEYQKAPTPPPKEDSDSSSSKSDSGSGSKE